MGLSANQEQLLVSLRRVALELGESGRSLTALIGELSACRLLALTWQPSVGFDAIGADGHSVEIKSRKSWTTEAVNPLGRLGRFGKKGTYGFAIGILVELNDFFEVAGIWQLDRDHIELLESKESKGRGLHVYTFEQAAKRVYPVGDRE